MSNQYVWVVKVFDLEDLDIDIDVFCNEVDALNRALDIGIEYMEEMNANDPNKPDWYDYYNRALYFRNLGNPKLGLKAYKGWMSTIDVHEDVFTIDVYPKQLYQSKSSANMNDPIEEEPKYTINRTVIPNTGITKENVPCKFCRTSLEKGESPCWKCGTKEPTDLVGVIQK